MCKRILTIGLWIACSYMGYGQAGWYELGTGVHALSARHEIRAIVTDPSGTVYAAGPFNSSTDQYYVARWDGTDWAETGTGTNALDARGYISALGTDAAGNIYAAGEFTNSDLNQRVARWNGSTWTDLAPASLNAGPNEFIRALHVVASDDIYAAGHMLNSAGRYYVAHWNGTSWAELGTGAQALNANGVISALWGDGDGNVYAAGAFRNGSGKQYVAKWNGSGWSELAPGTYGLNANGMIQTITGDAFGNIYAAGSFSNSNGKMYVARWNGNTWQEVGTGPSALNANATINRVCTDATGNVYAAGEFTNVYGHQYVAKWDGIAWSELGAGPGALHANSSVMALHTAGAKIYAGGSFDYTEPGIAVGMKYVAVYDGVTAPPVERIEVKTTDGGPALITNNGGTLDLTCVVLPLSTSDTAAWSIVPVTGTANIAGAGGHATITALSNGTVWAKAVSLVNPAMKDSLLVTISSQGLGIGTPGAGIGLEVYPNPAKALVHIYARNDHPELSVTLMDRLGRAISSRKLKANELKGGLVYKLDDLASGLYFVTFSAPGIWYSHKITKE